MKQQDIDTIKRGIEEIIQKLSEIQTNMHRFETPSHPTRPASKGYFGMPPAALGLGTPASASAGSGRTASASAGSGGPTPPPRQDQLRLYFH